jgi:hypothetical protein
MRSVKKTAAKKEFGNNLHILGQLDWVSAGLQKKYKYEIQYH